MAQPITLEITPRDPRRELILRLERAPVEHAEAILSALEVLQGLHDRQLLEMMRGILGSEGKVLEVAIETMKSPEVVRGIRNLIILAKTMGSIDPALLQAFVVALPQALGEAKAEAVDPPGIWKLFRQFCRRDSRRGLAVVNNLLETWGKNLNAERKRTAD